jgi:hypothetical protein
MRTLVLIIVSLSLIWSGCSLGEPTYEARIGDLGRFEAYAPFGDIRRVMIGAPHGAAEPAAVEYARSFRERTGAGLVVASGFGRSRLPVLRSLVVSAPPVPASEDPLRRGSIYKEFKQLLERTGGGKVRFYVGVRLAGTSQLGAIEVATSGFGFEQLNVLKELYRQISDRELEGTSLPKIAIAIEPLDRISWEVSGIKHHGVLMSAERGLNIRLPKRMGTERYRAAYKRVLANWVAAAVNLAHTPLPSLPHVEVTVMEHGRIEFVPPGKQWRGVVIAAPHGTFDEHTADVVRQISCRTGIAAVIANGFTPTETPGWRINVNRPSERHYPGGELEIASARARKVYDVFRRVVLAASEGSLKLYVDIHQNARHRDIEVSTVGISPEDAQAIKNSFRAIRDVVLKGLAQPAAVDLRIEPIDELQIGAWAAKIDGILSVAEKSLHFELPLHDTLGTAEARAAYGRILELLLARASELLTHRADRVVDAKTPGSSIKNQDGLSNRCGSEAYSYGVT